MRMARYEGLGHSGRADFSAYLQGLRERTGLSQSGLADELTDIDVPPRVIHYFESHPTEPLSKTNRREQLTAICRKLAERLGEDPAAVLAKANRLGGGLG